MLQEFANICEQIPVSTNLSNFIKTNNSQYNTSAISVFVQPDIWALASAPWFHSKTTT